MSKHRKNWSVVEKQKILLFAEEHGVSEASREFGVSTVSIYKWKGILQVKGSKGLERGGSLSSLEQELRALQRENQALKRLVADKELAIQIKDSLLKKSQFLKK